MSSMERAPEPTMEEILASIRRIISDDETNAERQEPAPEGYVRPAAADDSEEGIADTQIIADIERVLAGAGSQPEPAEDEILDLTDLGAMTEAAAAPVDAEMVEDLGVAELTEEIFVEPVPAPSFANAFPPSAEPETPAEPVAPMEPVHAEPAPPYVAEEAQPMPAPSYTAPQAREPIYTPPPVRETASVPSAAAEDPTVALERAIAALKAGDLAAFARVAESKPTPAAPAMPPPAAPTPAAHEPLPAAGPTLAEQFAVPEEPQAVVEVVEEEEEFVILSEPQLEPEPVPAQEASWSPPEPEEVPAASGVSTPWHSDDTTWSPKTAPSPDFAASPPRTNGGTAHKAHDFQAASSKSLEDSVKEMLRPMLRKWLDENMQRVLTQALREELEDPETRRRQG